MFDTAQTALCFRVSLVPDPVGVRGVRYLCRETDLLSPTNQ